MSYIDEKEWERRANLARQRGASEQYISQMRQKYAGSIKPNQPKENLLVSVGKAVVDPAIKASRDLVGGTITGVGALSELSSRVTDRDNKNKIGDKIMQAGMNIMTPQGREAVTDRSGKKAFTTGIQRGAGVASYLVPGGKTFKSAVGLGATSGALYGTSQGNKIDVNNIAMGAVGGGIGGGASYGLFKGYGAAKNAVSKTKEKFVKTLANDATQSYNKATPTAYQKAVEEHGIDINELTRKHVPSGADYDAMLGSVKERGRGGILGEKMNMAEDVINRTTDEAGGNIRISVDDFVNDLKKEVNVLKRVPGNETNISALKSLIKETQRVYKNGVSAKRLLDIKRAADSKFGKAVVDETTGSVTAQYQKMLANSSRSKLKTLFPDIADALDLETEIFTLRPVLEKARGTLNTQGSTIRTGQWSNVNMNPTTWGGIPSAIYNNNPATASRMFNNVSRPASITTPNISGRPGFIGSQVGGRIGAGTVEPNGSDQGYNPINSVGNNTNGNNTQSQLNHSQNIPQNSQNSTPRQTGLVSPSQAALYAQQGISLKNMWVVHPDGSKVWNPNTQKWVAYDSKAWGDTTRKLTDKQRSFVGAGEIGKELVNLLETSENTQIGPIAGRLSKIYEVLGTEDPEQTQLKSKVATARTAARNALLGANMSDKELQSFLDATFDINLPRNILMERLKTFVSDMNTLAQTETTGVATDGGGY